MGHGTAIPPLAAGDTADYNRTASDGSHRSHRFIGANQMMPALLKIPGAETQIAMTEAWLRGEFEIPEIADKWAHGPAVTIELTVPEETGPGEEVPIRAIVTSNKVGHDFPTGPLDIIQSWVELTIVDAEGATVFSSGTLDERNFIEPGAFMFKAEPVDQYGNLIAEPAEQPRDAAHRFRFVAPRSAPGPLRITARLLYRKIDQYLLNFMFGESAGLTAPVTEMARAEATLRVRAAGSRAALTPERPGTIPRPDRWGGGSR